MSAAPLPVSAVITCGGVFPRPRCAPAPPSPIQGYREEHKIYSSDRVATSPLRLRVGPSVLAKTTVPVATLLVILYLAIFTVTLVRSSAFQESLHGPVLCEFIPEDAPPSQQEEIRDYLGCGPSPALVLFAGTALIALIPVFAMTYVSVRVLRFRADLFGTALVIQGALKAKQSDWEAWFLAPWLPGAHRHRSFWDPMKDE